MNEGTDRDAGAKGREIVEGLNELAETLRAGKPLEARFTVRTYRIARPPEYGGDDVKRVRELPMTSQAAFAAFLGADRSTVQSWEQGLRSPSPLACRLLSEIEAEPSHWRRRLAACLVGPETRIADPNSGTNSSGGRRPRPVRKT